MDYKLCYVCPSTRFAWFTSISLKEQWGDDWDDAPYEHNAGDPYADHYSSLDANLKNRKRIKHDLLQVAWSSLHQMPCTNQINSPWSVKGINSGNIAWLTVPHHRQNDDNAFPIFAGTTLREFIGLIKRCGGEVFLPTRFLDVLKT